MQRLATRLARGEEGAFDELYDMCADRLHHFLTVRLGSTDRASDVLQNAFLRAVRNRRRFAGVDSPAAYLFQIARNEAARWANREKRRAGRPLTAEELFDIADNEHAQHDDAEVVTAALARLDTDDREIIELKDGQS